MTPADDQQRYGTAIVDVESSRFKGYQLTKIPSPSEAAGNTRYEPSRRIGPFKLLQSLGHGGMGEVWMADQLEPVKRRVALKLVKSGMDSKQMLARFEAERQAGAMLGHPPITKVLDGGYHEGRDPRFCRETCDSSVKRLGV